MKRNVELPKQNIAKANTKASAVRSLIQRTFAQRRRWILETVMPLNEILAVYPHLSKPLYVSEAYIFDYLIIVQLIHMYIGGT